MKCRDILLTVGGKGSRLRNGGINVPLTKSFLEVNGKTLFFWNLHILKEAGMTRVVVIADSEEKLNRAKEVAAEFKSGDMEVVFEIMDGINCTSLPYNSKYLFSGDFFFESGHHLFEPELYAEMDSLKEDGNVVFATYVPNNMAPRTFVHMKESGEMRLDEDGSPEDSSAVSFPCLIDRDYLSLLPQKDFLIDPMLQHYAEKRSLKLVRSGLPVEVDEPAEWKLAEMMYSFWLKERGFSV